VAYFPPLVYVVAVAVIDLRAVESARELNDTEYYYLCKNSSNSRKCSVSGAVFFIVVSLMTLLAISNTQPRMVQCLVTDDSARSRKEAGVATEGIVRLKRDGTRAETRFRLSAKQTSPFKSAGASVQSTAGRRGVRISASNAEYTTFRGNVRVLATHSIRQFPLHFPSRASPCAIRFQTHSTTPECAWNNSRMPRKPSFTVAEIADKIQTMHLQDTV
jgi:hypothetical protein